MTGTAKPSKAGSRILLVVPICTVVVGYALFFLGWPETGIIAEVTRMHREHGSVRYGAAPPLLLIAISLGIGALPAFLVTRAIDRILERLRPSCVFAGAVSDVVALTAYAAWVAAVLFTPAGSVLVRSILIPILALATAVIVVVYLTDGLRYLTVRLRRRRRADRRHRR